MTPPFVPLSGRVLLEPMEPDRTTESGLVLVEHRKPETMGRVVAVSHAGDDRVTPLRACLSACRGVLENTDLVEQVDLLLEATADAPEPAVSVGDVVLFSWVSGQEIMLDDARYLIMPESDILAVVEDA